MSYEIHTRDLFETDDRSFSDPSRNVAWRAASIVVAFGGLIALVSLLIAS
jgi:hypothetical protein